MKKNLFFLLVLVCFCNCNEKKETVDFEPLKKEQFNANPFEIPKDQVPELLKHAHDSCMGFSFDANALFIRRRDSLFIGNIVNRQSLKTVNTIKDLGVTLPELMSNFNIIAKPCYEKKDFHFPLQSLLGKDFTLQFPNAGQVVNKEINDAISASGDIEMQTGSWVYLDMKDALRRILDTTRNRIAMRYKDNLLDTSNMVLTAAESITDISFVINTSKDMSEPLQAFLKSKPSLSKPNSQGSIQLFYLNSNKLQMNFFGFFPVVGQFMKAELKKV